MKKQSQVHIDSTRLFGALRNKGIKICISRCAILHVLYSFWGEVLKGYHAYRKIKQKTGGARIFLQYYQGTGDVYLSSAYLKYCEMRQDKLDNAVYVVNGVNAYKIASLIGIENVPIEKLSEKEAYALVHLTRFMGQNNVDIRYLHYMSDYPMYTCFFIALAGLHSIGFMDLYRGIVFDGETFELPAPQWNVDNRFSTVEKKKVLLAPVANSIAEGPSALFWRALAEQLKRSGYEVYTNLSGDERPIDGTKPVFIPYGDLASFLDKNTVFIGYRSGLCDLIASLQCKKIILYPDKCWPTNNGLDIGSTLDIFSLNKMGICEDAVELVYSAGEESEILSEILQAVTGYQL